MVNIFKQLKQLNEEIERLKIKYESAAIVSNNYCGWMFAYRNAIAEMTKDGVLSKEQSDMLFSKAKKYYDHYWQTH